jgi:hypothetical protein
MYTCMECGKGTEVLWSIKTEYDSLLKNRGMCEECFDKKYPRKEDDLIKRIRH